MGLKVRLDGLTFRVQRFASFFGMPALFSQKKDKDSRIAMFISRVGTAQNNAMVCHIKLPAAAGGGWRVNLAM